MQLAWVQELRVLIHLPEDDLIVHGAGHDAITTKAFDAVDFTVMTIMRVQVAHLSKVPDLECSVLRDSVELVILCVKSDACDTVTVAQELLNLRLIVDVPNAHNSILAS